jgi:hypothetical protein
MASWKDYQTDWILFLEAGFIAVNQADEASALKLFTAAELLNPSSVMPKIGFGYLNLHKLELKKACKSFEEVLKKEPDNEMAKTLLGISMSFSPKLLVKGEKILEEQVRKSRDPDIKRLSETAIDFVDKFIKKGGSSTAQKRANSG